jgi:hypothetical protein
MDPLTDDELKAIEARANAATPGPWKAEGDDECILYVRAANGHTVVTTDSGVYTTDEDAIFIAAARTDVPKLVAEVRRLREAFVDAWDAGFHSSGEGWNGEYPFDHGPGRPTAEELARLQKSRDEALAQFMTMK